MNFVWWTHGDAVTKFQYYKYISNIKSHWCVLTEYKFYDSNDYVDRNKIGFGHKHHIHNVKNLLRKITNVKKLLKTIMNDDKKLPDNEDGFKN